MLATSAPRTCAPRPRLRAARAGARREWVGADAGVVRVCGCVSQAPHSLRACVWVGGRAGRPDHQAGNEVACVGCEASCYGGCVFSAFNFYQFGKLLRGVDSGVAAWVHHTVFLMATVICPAYFVGYAAPRTAPAAAPLLPLPHTHTNTPARPPRVCAHPRRSRLELVLRVC